MRVGFITGEYPPMRGGLGAFTDILSKHLQRLGHDVFIFTTCKSEAQSPEIPVTNDIKNWGLQSNRRVNQWANQNRLDIVNLQYQTAAYDMSPWIHVMPMMVDVPFITTFHDLRVPYLLPKAGPLREWIVMHLARSSDGVIVTNHEDLARVSHLKARMIPIGSNIPAERDSDTKALRKCLNISDGDRLVAHFGFLNNSKGIDTLIQSINLITDETVKLLMIGERTGSSDPTNVTFADTINRMIETLGLRDRVRWTGYVEDREVSAYLQLADIVVLPFRDGASFRRGTLMAAIESGCAIVTTHPSVTIPEFTSDSLSFVEVDEPQQLADKIMTLLDDPDRLKRMGEHTGALRQHFDWQTIAIHTATFMQQITGVLT